MVNKLRHYLMLAAIKLSMAGKGNDDMTMVELERLLNSVEKISKEITRVIVAMQVKDRLNKG